MKFFTTTLGIILTLVIAGIAAYYMATSKWFKKNLVSKNTNGGTKTDADQPAIESSTQRMQQAPNVIFTNGNARLFGQHFIYGGYFYNRNPRFPSIWYKVSPVIQTV